MTKLNQSQFTFVRDCLRTALVFAISNGSERCADRSHGVSIHFREGLLAHKAAASWGCSKWITSLNSLS
jgi:hypothetical protein